MRRRRKCRGGVFVFSAMMIITGFVLMCCFSYKFLIFLTAAALIVIGLILIGRQ